jgi:hypothetical protein
VCGTTATTTRLIARVAPNGIVDMSTSYQSETAYYARGVASPDGATIYASGAWWRAACAIVHGGECALVRLSPFSFLNPPFL